MPTHSRTHSDATQIAEKILKEAAEPRLPASVKEALEKKKTPVAVGPQPLDGTKVGKTKAAKARAST